MDLGFKLAVHRMRVRGFTRNIENSSRGFFASALKKCPKKTVQSRTLTNVIMSKQGFCIWVVVKILVPFWVLSIIRHLIFRGPK